MKLKKITLMFKKKFKIVKEDRAAGILPYRILERHTIFFFIHWWSSTTFLPIHLHQTFDEAISYVKEQCPNAIIESNNPYE